MKQNNMSEMIDRVARKIAGEEPAFKPPRTDLQKRVKKKELPREEKADYSDTLFDRDMKLASQGVEEGS